MKKYLQIPRIQFQSTPPTQHLFRTKKKKKTHVKTKHPKQVDPQIKNTLTPKFAALIPFIPKVVALTRYGVAYPIPKFHNQLLATDNDIPFARIARGFYLIIKKISNIFIRGGGGRRRRRKLTKISPVITHTTGPHDIA